MSSLLLARFVRRQEGAVTVDWVVITAAVIGLGIGVILTVSDGSGNVATTLGSSLSDATPPDVVFN